MDSSTPNRWAVANRSRDTRGEILIRSALHRAGYRFRKHALVDLPEIRVRVDVLFPRSRLAVFVDGCFWHDCPDHGGYPVSNSDYWLPKLKHNAERDRAVDAALRAGGWTVVRLWEHVDSETGAQKVVAILAELRSRQVQSD